MHINKEFITNVVAIVFVIAISARILIPIIIDSIKGKQLGVSKNSNDIDYMIKRQKEILKSQYNISSPHAVVNKTPVSSDIAETRNEISWGGTELHKDIKTKMTTMFSYQFSDSKLNSFLTLIDKRNYLYYLDSSKSNDQLVTKESIINFLSTLFILLVIIDEIKDKQLNFSAKCAKKLNVSSEKFALAIQIKILKSISDKYITDDKIYSTNLILNQLSDEQSKRAIDTLVENETGYWKKSISYFFEELTLYLSYAEILLPLKKPNSKNDFETALRNLNSSEETSEDELKKTYKKLALIYHPDKIVPQKLPKKIEAAALLKFNIIQESFEIMNSRKKQ